MSHIFSPSSSGYISFPSSFVGKEVMRTEIQVKIVSKQHIKPSSPTPQNLRHLLLSSLDEIQPRISMPFVLFFSQNSSTPVLQRSNHLKTSLSDALTIFYPLAGRVRDNSHVECNDEGVLFAEAVADCQLSEILENKYSTFQNYKFIPLQPDEGGDVVAYFQVTFFNCGGYAVSFAMSHKLGDGLSQFIFLNSWDALARENIKVDIPPFGLATLFPPKRIPELFPIDHFKEKIATRVFAFEATTVSALRDKYTFNGEKLSRVYALAAFILSRFIAVAHVKDANTQYRMSFPVNFRSRTVPPMPELSFGNLFTTVTVVADKEETESDMFCYRIAKKMKDAAKNVNEDYAHKLRKSDDHLNSIQQITREVVGGKNVNFGFSSLCNFPAYDVDFGWGRPEWVAMGALFFKNFVVFFDAKEGEMIEAFISLHEDEMAKFEVDNELLSHVSSSFSRNGNFQSLKKDAQSRL